MPPSVRESAARAVPTGPGRGLIALSVLDAAKLALLLLSGLGQPWPDSVGYWSLGRDVAAGDLGLWGARLGYRTPGYPWFLGGLQWALGDRALLATAILQQGCVWLTHLIVVLWTWRLSGSRRGAQIAYALCVCSTARPLYANWVLTETLATFVLVGVSFLLSSTGNAARLRPLLLAGLLAGIGILIRPSLIVLPVAVLAAGLWQARSLSGPRNRIAAIVGPALLTLLTAVPWAARNNALFGRWTLVTFTGRELWTASFSPWPGAGLAIPQDGPGRELRDRITAGPKIDFNHNWSVAGALANSGLNDAELDRLMERTAWQAILRQPGRAALHAVARCLTFWYCREFAPPVNEMGRFIPPTSMSIPSSTREAVLTWAPERQQWFVIAGAISGLCVVLLIRDPATLWNGLLLAGLCGGTTLLTACLEIPTYRYRLPLEPLLIVAVASVASRLLNGPKCEPTAGG